MYNGRDSSQLNKIDSLRCAVATASAIDKRTLKGRNIGELVIAIASSYEAWLNGSGSEIPEEALRLMELEVASGKE